MRFLTLFMCTAVVGAGTYYNGWGSSNGYCTQISPCPACHGDCDSDSECQGNLRCFQRGTGDPGPSYCKGAPIKSYDYCFDPNYDAKKEADQANKQKLNDEIERLKSATAIAEQSIEKERLEAELAQLKVDLAAKKQNTTTVSKSTKIDTSKHAITINVDDSQSTYEIVLPVALTALVTFIGWLGKKYCDKNTHSAHFNEGGYESNGAIGVPNHPQIAP